MKIQSRLLFKNTKASTYLLLSKKTRTRKMINPASLSLILRKKINRVHEWIQSQSCGLCPGITKVHKDFIEFCIFRKANQLRFKDVRQRLITIRPIFNRSIYLSIYLSTYLSIYLPIYLSIYLSIYLPIYLNARQLE